MSAQHPPGGARNAAQAPAAPGPSPGGTGLTDAIVPNRAPFIHGTYAGWQKHRRRGETPCTACLDATAQYHRDHRAGNVLARRKDRWWNSTRSKALERLVAEYPQRFAEILAEIRADTPHEWAP